MRLYRCLALLGLLGFFALQGGPAVANENDPTIHAQPGSVLIFPLFDSTEQNGTLISVTNTNTSTQGCDENNMRVGDICLHYIYINHNPDDPGTEGDEESCLEFDRFECLTPGDTLTVAADQHNPQLLDGWLWIEARDPETLDPVAYNYLIGSAIIVESATEFVWSYTPYSFKGLPTNGDQPGCGEYFATDVDQDGEADFNGTEYTPFPDDLLLDSFFAEGGARSMSNELTLMSVRTDTNTNVSAYIWNNVEDRFSRGFVFQCHSRAPLSTISNIVKQANLGSQEKVQGDRFESGWVQFKSTAGILGVYKHESNANDFGAGKELFVDGTQSVSIDR